MVAGHLADRDCHCRYRAHGMHSNACNETAALAAVHVDAPDQRDDLLIRADSLLSLIRHRESSHLMEQTIRDLDALLGPLRRETDRIVAERRHS